MGVGHPGRVRSLVPLRTSTLLRERLRLLHHLLVLRHTRIVDGLLHEVL
jgi:hypothetical protein